MTRTSPVCAPRSAPATSCCAKDYGWAWPRSRRAKTPTRWCRKKVPRDWRRSSRTRSMCWNGRSRSSTARDSSAPCRAGAARSTGCSRRFERRPTRSRASSTSHARRKPRGFGRMCWNEKPGCGMRPSPTTHPASRISPPDLPASAEKALLLLMLEGEPWRARVIEAVDPEELEFPPYRAVFESVADDAVLALDDTSARAYEQLKAEGLGRRDPNEMYELAVNWMEARRLERQLE